MTTLGDKLDSIHKKIDSMDYSACATTSLQAMKEFTENQIEKWDRAEQMAGYAMHGDLNDLKINMLSFLSAIEKSIETKAGKVSMITHSAATTKDGFKVILTYEDGSTHEKEYKDSSESMRDYKAMLNRYKLK